MSKGARRHAPPSLHTQTPPLLCAQVFDVAAFDMIAMLRLPFVPGVVEWVFKVGVRSLALQENGSAPQLLLHALLCRRAHAGQVAPHRSSCCSTVPGGAQITRRMLPCPAPQRGDAKTKLAVSDLDSPAVHIYDLKSGSNDPIDTLTSLHAAPVTAMRYSERHNTVISADKKGGWAEGWAGVGRDGSGGGAKGLAWRESRVLPAAALNLDWLVSCGRFHGALLHVLLSGRLPNWL